MRSVACDSSRQRQQRLHRVPERFFRLARVRGAEQAHVVGEENRIKLGRLGNARPFAQLRDRAGRAGSHIGVAPGGQVVPHLKEEGPEVPGGTSKRHGVHSLYKVRQRCREK